MKRRTILALACGLALAVTCKAQCDPGGSVSLLIDGKVPAVEDPAGHQVMVASGTDVTLSVADGGMGNAFLLVAGPAVACGTLFVPWGGTIDVAAPFIVGDGLNPATFFDFFLVTDFELTFSVACGAGGVTPAVQAVHSDPTNPPFNLDQTQAGQAAFYGDVCTIYENTLADDGWATHVLAPPVTVTYGGTTYTQMFVGTNGQITFVNGDLDFSPTLGEFYAGFNNGGGATVTANPGVASFWGDFNRTSAATDRIVVVEDTATGVVIIQYENQEWWDSQTPSGSWSCAFGVLGADSLRLDLRGVIPGVPGTDQNPIVGVSDGDSTNLGLDTSVDWSTVLPYFTPFGMGPESIAEQFPMAGADPIQPFDLGVLSFVHFGNFEWNVF